jgi:sulfhydrogenase subunit beta (sulfur reductase)
MECGTISKTDLGKLISAALEDNTVFYAPADGRNGIELRTVTSQEEIAFGYDNLKLSPKSVLFPQNEVLCRYTGDTVEEVQIEAEDAIVFGIRPCDVFALSCLDKVFGGANDRFQDPYYMSRREKALIIALVCDEPRTTCFCTSVGGGPGTGAGSDILATELAEVLLFESYTEKGKSLIEGSELFRQPTSDEMTEKEEIIRRAEESMVEIPKPDMEGLAEKLDKGFEDPLWDSMTQSCLGCGVCTYLCPTCHCFDITDEKDRKGDGIRLRTWDSCQYPLFTVHASGHNPRVNKKQRMRQRIMHKFAYAVENTGETFCVGCGRCVIHCPVNLDIRDMLTALDKL